MLPPVWLITGSSSGFGKALTFLALRSGHKVIATSRNPVKSPELVAEVQELGGEWHTLDVCSPESELSTAVQKAISVYGRIDIFVNCAAYALIGAFETLSNEQTRDQMNTNFFGPLTLIRLILPSMRERGSGTIVNFSSTQGIEGRASRSIYAASKFALEGFSESLAEEVAPLGIRVLIISPGAFKSNFTASINYSDSELPKEYKGTAVEKMLEGMRLWSSQGADAKLPGDVEKGAQAVFDVIIGKVEGVEDFLRIPLGKDGVARWRFKIENLQKTLDGTEQIWSNTDLVE